jgi:hypothetical protein
MNIFCFKFKLELGFLYNNTTPPVICERLHFIHMGETLACPLYFIKRGELAHITSITRHFNRNACIKTGK